MNIIVACDKNWGIGKDGHLLCHLSGDLKYFKEMTLGKTVVMGRVTLESLPGKKGLPGRRNIVLTKDPDYQAENAEVVHSRLELEDAVADTPTDEVFIIGGARIYEQFLLFCHDVYVTKVDAEFEADRFFRDMDDCSRFYLADSSEVMEENGIRYQFRHYEKEPPEGGRR